MTIETAAAIIDRAKRARYMLMHGAAALARAQGLLIDEAPAPNEPAEAPASKPAPEAYGPPTRFDLARRIIREVSNAHGLHWKDVVSDSRRHPFVRARQEIFSRIKDEIPDASLPWIGRRVGGRDHTTVLHGVNVHRARIAFRGERLH